MQKCINFVELGKCCKMNIYSQNICFGPAEKGPFKDCLRLASIGIMYYQQEVTKPCKLAHLESHAGSPTSSTRSTRTSSAATRRRCPTSGPGGTGLLELAASRGIGQTLQGSFSAVSKPNFARKYAFESSRRDLHNALLCTAL